MLIKTPIYVTAIFLLCLSLMPLNASGRKFPDEDYDTKKCEDCHRSPKYTKDDAETLKECIVCHGSKGHPLKGDPLKGDGESKGEAVIASTEKKQLTKEDLTAMTKIPRGEFLMGTFERHNDEGPLHVAYINGFYIDNYEVTNGDYKEFIDATGHKAPDHWADQSDADRSDGSAYPQKIKNHPVVFVDWYNAVSYCKWKSKRLPTEWEWEKAARGTDGRTYPWGNDFDMTKSNNPIAESEGTLPVGSYPEGVSPYGLFDMSGNVWEWVQDEYRMHPGSDNLSREEDRGHKMLKGGSWWSCSFYNCGTSAPSYNRSFFSADTKSSSYGFRCVVSEDMVAIENPHDNNIKINDK